MRKKITKPVKPTWGATLTPVELLQLLEVLDQKRLAREINRATVAQARKQKIPNT